jgi:hypothetical protein
MAGWTGSPLCLREREITVSRPITKKHLLMKLAEMDDRQACLSNKSNKNTFRSVGKSIYWPSGASRLEFRL